MGVVVSLMSVSKKPRLTTTLLTAMSSFSSVASALLAPIQQTTVLSTFPTGGSKVIGTHDGSFHCDEALAISMLKVLPEFKESTVVRTRKPDILGQCHIVVDVGAEYNAETLRFDHHQREFTGVLDPWKTKLSSAGLVYKHYGKEIIKEILKSCENVEVTTDFVDICYRKVYEGFMEHIDAIDNGISVSDEPAKYHVSTTLSNRVGHLNPAWNEPNTPEAFNNGFIQAMTLTGSEFITCVERLAQQWWPARSIVQKAVDQRFTHHSSGSILILDSQCPWKDHLFEIEKEQSLNADILYVLYADSGGSWRIQAVPVEPTSFSSRKRLLEPHMGLRDESLSGAVGVPGCIFVHASGFIGGHKDKAGALQMAIKSLGC